MKLWQILVLLGAAGAVAYFIFRKPGGGISTQPTSTPAGQNPPNTGGRQYMLNPYSPIGLMYRAPREVQPLPADWLTRQWGQA